MWSKPAEATRRI